MFPEYFEKMRCLFARHSSHRVLWFSSLSSSCSLIHFYLWTLLFFCMAHPVLSVLSVWSILGDLFAHSSSCLLAHGELPFPLICSLLDTVKVRTFHLCFLTLVGFICSLISSWRKLNMGKTINMGHMGFCHYAMPLCMTQWRGIISHCIAITCLKWSYI